MNSNHGVINLGQMRTTRILMGLVSKKLLAAIQYGSRASVYNSHVTAAELTTAQCIILTLFHGLLSSDFNLCQIIQQYYAKVDQLRSPYLISWLRDDFCFNCSDVVSVLSTLAHLVRSQHLVLPDYILRVFVGLNTKYGVLDIIKEANDFETFVFLASVNVPCNRSQQTDPITV